MSNSLIPLFLPTLQYINRVRANIHIVLCMSPLGEAFRTRLRMFPSIVNCCTIDWFMEWPDEVRHELIACKSGKPFESNTWLLS